jgi:acyl-CoA synthetase (AMP-forming)/AMP-acid ligase II
MPRPNLRFLWDLVAASGLPCGRFVADAVGRTALRDLDGGTSLEVDPDALRGRSVLIASERQLPALLSAIELDGIARRMVLCPPDATSEQVAVAMTDAAVDVVVSDGTGPVADWCGGLGVRNLGGRTRRFGTKHNRRIATEWLLFTSGTSGRPKLVVHNLASLTGPLDDRLVVASDAVWSTFYDIRRYGGLQIMLRACLGGASMVLSQTGEPVGDFLIRAGAAGVTHISGTPSHWRRALMSPTITHLAPRYVRLSGEVADQAILNSLRLAFPEADVAHAFASTEAGVAFDVRDGLAGFPASLIGQPDAKVQMRVIDGSLRIRSARTALGYAGAQAPALRDAGEFVDTGDMVELRDGRYHFIGRREGIINVGGLKVHPEEVEAVINLHPDVRMSRVRGRPSPITGAIVVADIVADAPGAIDAVMAEILETCRRMLPQHKVPFILKPVRAIDIGGSGKLARPHA